MSGLFFFYAFSVNAQSGWTKDKGDLFAKISYLNFGSDKYYNLSGNSMQTSECTQNALGLYGEYGITDRLTLLMDWSFLKSQGFETTENVTGIGDMKLGVKYALVKKIPISISVIPDLPLAQSNKYAQNKINSFEQINLPTGDGEFNVFSVLAISTSLYPIPVYANFYIGYNFRTKYQSIALSDQLLAGLEVGYNPIKPVWLKLGIKIQQTLSSDNPSVSFVRGEGTEFTSIYGGVFYQFIERWGIDVNYFGYLNGPQPRRNIYSGSVYSIGLVFELKREEQ
ncbi:hypothetical protein [Reichenbachiella sp. MALMAid0571]|uniref:hypothetical protein n=1 Tax=Reichenbachiella sp. MALMAid0571 TaxID=3143939 RepID=UPI0032E00A09